MINESAPGSTSHAAQELTSYDAAMEAYVSNSWVQTSFNV
jgi:hypothetical protein